jgi:hypothetical protein
VLKRVTGFGVLINAALVPRTAAIKCRSQAGGLFPDLGAKLTRNKKKIISQRGLDKVGFIEAWDRTRAGLCIAYEHS